MESDRVRSRTSLRWAVGVSLLLHAAVLFIGYSSSGPGSRSGVMLDGFSVTPPPGLTATLVGPVTPRADDREVPPARDQRNTPAPAKAAERPKLSASSDGWAAQKWTPAERAEMDQFLDELAAEARPKSGGEVAQQALAQARQAGRGPQDGGAEDPAGTSASNGQTVEPFSWEMYFDAFVRKLNRGAAFVKRDPGARGSRGTRKALVRISLNADGSLKSYRVMRAADREAELDYIRRVVEQAAPFSAFPPDIRGATDTLNILLCVYPPHEGGGGFARSFGDEDCRD